MSHKLWPHEHNVYAGTRRYTLVPRPLSVMSRGMAMPRRQKMRWLHGAAGSDDMSPGRLQQASAAVGTRGGRGYYQ